MQITLTLNGQPKTLNKAINVEELLREEGFQSMTVAVAKNGDFIAKSAYASTTLNDGDQLEIVAPMQGG